MKKVLLFIYRTVALAVALFLILGIASNLAALDIFPSVVGNGQNDSVVLTFETFDTTASPLPSNPDSLKILHFGPSGEPFDSLGEEDGRVINIRTGSYEVHLKSTDSLANMGRYLVRVYAYKGDQIKGAASGGYYVKGGNWDDLDSTLADVRAILDTLQDGFASQSHQSNLDTTVSSRSTLTSADNIGINWLDIANPTVFQYLPNTYIGGLLSPISVDTEEVARSVWNDDIIAQNLRTVDLSGCQSGGGAYACSLFVFDQSDSSALQGVVVRFMNESQTATEAVAMSDPNGLALVSLDAAKYRVWTYKAGVLFADLPDSVIVAAPSVVDTLWGSRFDPGDPVAAELCRVYGWIYDLSGAGISGVTVAAGINKTPIRYQGMLISPYYRSAVSDSSGYWFLDLYPSASLTPDDLEYEFVIYYESGRIARKKLKVPDLTSWQFNW